MHETQTLEHPVSENQRAIAEWFAGYLRKELPPECLESNSAWWKFFMQNLVPIHRDMAITAKHDFSLSVDIHDPISVVGAMKYLIEAESSEKQRKEAQVQAARKQLIAGVDIYSVSEQFGLDDDEVWRIVDRLEAEGREIQTE